MHCHFVVQTVSVISLTNASYEKLCKCCGTFSSKMVPVKFLNEIQQKFCFLETNYALLKQIQWYFQVQKCPGNKFLVITLGDTVQCVPLSLPSVSEMTT